MVDMNTVSSAISAFGLIMIVWAYFIYAHLKGPDYYFDSPDIYLLYLSFYFGTWAGINLLRILRKQK